MRKSKGFNGIEIDDSDCEMPTIALDLYLWRTFLYCRHRTYPVLLSFLGGFLIGSYSHV